VRCEAADAVRSKDYLCPECGKVVHVRRRKNYITHFYHLVFANCASDGEGAQHLVAKSLIGEEYRSRGVDVAYEWTMEREFARYGLSKFDFSLCSRRTDLMLRTKGAKGEKRYAIEIQDSNLPERDFNLRCKDWNAVGAAILWLVIPPQALSEFLVERADVSEPSTYTRYSWRPFEREIWKRTGEIWFVETTSGSFFRVEVREHLINKEHYVAYDSSIGDFREAGGYSYASVRWVDLVLSPAIRLDSLQIDATRKHATWRKRSN
jgi:Competence protein CoiA-like family